MVDVCALITTLRAEEVPITVTCLPCGQSWIARIDTLAAPCVHCGDEPREE